MDKFVVRESRGPADYPQGGQMMTFSPSAGNNNTNNMMMPETIYLGGYGAEFPIQRGPGFMPMTHVNTSSFSPNFTNQGQMVPGFDPRYLAAAAYMANQNQQMKEEQNTISSNGPAFTNDYENRTFIGADRNRPKTFTSRMTASSSASSSHSMPRRNLPTLQASASFTRTSQPNRQGSQSIPSNAPVPTPSKPPAKETDILKNEIAFPMKTRLEKLRELQKSGARVFSGPVEKVLKWHKALQDLGLQVIYEIVAKCVSVRPGERSAKNLVVRDDSGPAIQVVYYEIDFLLPDINPPCTVRVVGRMMPGTCRLQAFNVRPASGDDVATLQRRAAVAAHHVAKLCKEFGTHISN